MITAVKSFSDNSDICVILVLISIDLFFSFKLKFFCFMVCMMNDFFNWKLIFSVLWDSGNYLNHVLVAFFCHLSTGERDTTSLVPDEGRSLCSHTERRSGMKFQVSTRPHWLHWLEGEPYLVTTLHMASMDTTVQGVVVNFFHPLSLLWHHHSREGQDMSLLPSGDENPGSSTQLFLISPLSPPHPGKEGGFRSFVAAWWD